MVVRLLVVDDDPWILRMVKASLEKHGGYQVETAKDGQRALDRLADLTPDLIITDVMMPNMDGWALVRELRNHPQHRTIPVLFMTALGRDEERLHQHGLRPEDYISKPFRFAELERRVMRALARRDEAREPEQRQAPSAEQVVDPFAAAVAGARGGFVGNAATHLVQPAPDTEDFEQSFAGLLSDVAPPQSAPARAPESSSGAGATGAWDGEPTGVGGTRTDPAANHGPVGAPGMGRALPGQPAPGVPTPADASDTARIAPTAQAPSAGLSGRLEQLGLSSLLVMMEMERKCGILAIHGGDDESRTGRLFLRDGRVIQSNVDSQPDLGHKESVYEMLAWKTGRFMFDAMEVDMEDEVQSSTTGLLMEGARLMDEADR